MGKIFKSLPFKLLLGVVVGILLGLVANEAVMNVVVTIKQVLGQIHPPISSYKNHRGTVYTLKPRQ